MRCDREMPDIVGRHVIVGYLDAAGVPSLAPKPGHAADALANVGTNQNQGSSG